jgi:tetratricopeptide (TPR) repeat protein
MLILSVSFSSCRPPELEGAIVHFKQGRTDQSYELALQSTNKYPGNEEAWFWLGKIQGKKGMIAEMMTSFSKSLEIKNTHQGEIDLEKAAYYSKYYNDGVSAYNNYIKLDEENRNSEAATKALNSVIEDFSKATIIKQDFMANRLISISYQFLGDSVNEFKYLEKAAEVKPDTVLIWIEMGYYFMQKKDFNKAADYFQKGLATEPDNKECLTLYAQNLDFAGRQEEAIKAYMIAEKYNPTEKAIPFNLGLLYNKQANAIDDDDVKKKQLYSEAADEFKKAHELDPELKEVYDLLSALLLQTERYPEAEQLLKMGLEKFPESASMWQNWSYLQAKLGHKEEAEKAYERSKQLEEN